MIVHLYTVSLNEAAMLDFFFRHYRPFVTRFVFFDDNSTDGTRERLEAMPDVEVRQRPYSDPDSLVLSGVALRDHCWKESRGKADWVIVTDVDEHLHHPQIGDYLRRCSTAGVTLLPSLGYQMLTDEFPSPHEHLATTRTIGAPSAELSKLRIFNPDALEDVNFGAGGHFAAPTGRIALPAVDELLLLHYKHLGLEYTLARNTFLNSGRRAVDRQRGFGKQYEWTREDVAWVRSQIAKTTVDLRDPDHIPARDHNTARWWHGALATDAWSARRPDAAFAPTPEPPRKGG